MLVISEEGLRRLRSLGRGYLTEDEIYESEEDGVEYLYHTSSGEIGEVSSDGRFGSFLFFAGGIYVMSQVRDVYVYRVRHDDFDIVEQSNFFYELGSGLLSDRVELIASRYGVDEEVARGLLDGSESIFNILDSGDLGEADWDLQLEAGLAAKDLGYDGVEIIDEQGTAYLLDMLGREDLMEFVGVLAN